MWISMCKSSAGGEREQELMSVSANYGIGLAILGTTAQSPEYLTLLTVPPKQVEHLSIGSFSWESNCGYKSYVQISLLLMTSFM